MWVELKNAREGLGLSQKELGDKLGFSGGFITYWEKDYPESIKNFKAICEALSASPSSLLGWTIPEKKSTSADLPTGSTVVKPAKLSFSKKELEAIKAILDQRQKSLRAKMSDGLISIDDAELVNQIWLLSEKAEKMLKEAE